MPLRSGFVKQAGRALTAARRDGVGRRGQSHCLDHAVLGLHDFQQVVSDLEAGAGLRDILQMLEYQPVERFGSVEWETVAEFAVQFAQQAAALHQVAAIRLAVESRRLQRRVGREFADQLLNDVFQREQPH